MAVLDAGMGTQQSCPALCVCCRQVPIGAIKLAARKMATIARWKTHRIVVSAYYKSRFLR